MKRKLLIIEDDPGLQSQMRWCFEDIEVYVASDREVALTHLRRVEPQVITLDLGLPPDPGGASEGFRALEDILRLAPDTKVIVVTGREEKENAVAAIGKGASDFYQKPMDADILTFVVNRAFRLYELEKENKELTLGVSTSKVKGVIAGSRKMLEICSTVEKIAPADVTTLLLGETGTGKEVLANAIHQLSPRKDKPFGAINCGAIPENLLESELFGFEKGAFTGATQTKKGKIELADGGSLFLDEIGDMPMPLQVKLLRFLQERVIERVGGLNAIPVDVRVICATHQDIPALIDEGKFREDLYYRVSEISLTIPPLREREGDSIIIAQALLKSIGKEFNNTNLSYDEGAIKAIKSYHWPGNVREMINKVKRAVIMSDNKKVSAEDMELTPYQNLENEVLNLKHIREDAERNAILQALAATENNIAKAARMLGISRPTLYNLTDKFNITPSQES